MQDCSNSIADALELLQSCIKLSVYTGSTFKIDSTYFGTSSNVVIGIVYRIPDSSVEVFNERITDKMNVIHREKKMCYLLGDLNIDLFKCDDHKPTSNFLDTMYSYNMFPLIVKNQPA